MVSLYTIGHSTHTQERFLELLMKHQIQILVDIRALPFSKRMPWFTRERLATTVEDAGIRYVWMGDALGGRPKDPAMIDERGRVNYELVRRSALFRSGIRRLVEGAGEFRIAVMCAEEDPLHCHRHSLLGRALQDRTVELQHLRGDGRIEPAPVQPNLF